jgi:hypothetical protein
MTNRIAVLAAMATALGVAACASTPGTTPKPVASATPAGCVRDTGSRLTPAGGCAGLGRSYSHEDLARTGQTTVSDALGQLDPTITVTR